LSELLKLSNSADSGGSEKESRTPSTVTGDVRIAPRKIDSIKIGRWYSWNCEFHFKFTIGNRLFGDQTSLGKYKIIKTDDFACNFLIVLSRISRSLLWRHYLYS